MLKISLLEFFLRAVPESFLLILGTYILCDKKINKKQYIISSVILSICVYGVRMLPIHFGIHTVINMMIYIVISFKINAIPLNKCVPHCIIFTIISCICELINILIISQYLYKNCEMILSNDVIRVLAFIPSLILFTCTIVLLYIILNKIKKERQYT